MNLPMLSSKRKWSWAAAAALFAAAAWAVVSTPAQQVDKRVLDDEAKRMAVIEKIKPSVVAVFSPGGRGGGSGMLISEDGYALTNFHVVAGMMGLPAPVMQCGLPDGGYYHGVVVGTDKVGDVALIKLLPNKKGQKFPFSKLGDSDKVKEGDWSLAMGNPFLLATDFNPTVTFGLVSGVHRYQYPEGTLLEYTDCIQIDTSINPGNSGGPLFNMQGEIIGINGRGSFDKRSRINSGVGYAISSNQIKNFMGHLRAGLDVDHASLGADVVSDKDEGDLGRLIVTNVKEDDSDVGRRGLRPDDQLWKFGFNKRVLASVNQYKNILGTYPKHWRVPLVYRRENKDKQILVRLEGVQRQVEGVKPPPKPGPRPRPRPRPGPVGPPSPAAKLFKRKAGFANYYFNELERKRLLAGFNKHGDFRKLRGTWTITATVKLQEGEDQSAKFQFVEVNKVIKDKKGKKKVVKEPAVVAKIGDADYTVKPLNDDEPAAELKQPTASGGLLGALYLYRQFLTQGVKGLDDCYYGGYEPFYPPPANGKEPESWATRRVNAEVLNTTYGPYFAKWFFSPKDQTLLGFEFRLKENEDPCEVYFSKYKKVDGRRLPGRMDVRFANDPYGTFIMKRYTLNK